MRENPQPEPPRTWPRYRRAKAIWTEYKRVWAETYPGKPLPEFHNLPELTGIPKRTLARLYPPRERLPGPLVPNGTD